METSFANISASSVESEYVEESNLEDSLRCIEKELQTFGLPSIVDQDSSELKTSGTLNALHKLLQLHRYNLKMIEGLKESLMRGKSDVSMQREMQARLKEDIKSGEKELAMLEDRERQLNQKIKTLTSKLKGEQDEVRRLKTSMQYKETQRIHENKKKEKEFERLKQKLGQLVSDKSHERRLGVSMLNALNRTDGKRKLWNKPGSGDEDMYRIIIANYEERQKELMLENASLRESLAGMEKQLISLLNAKQAMQKIEQSHNTVPADEIEGRSPLMSSGHFQMPYDIVRDGIEQSVQDKCRLVKDHIDTLRLRIERLESASIVDAGTDFVDHESEIKKLEHQLSDYRNIIGQQEEMLLQKSLNSDEGESDPLVHNESSLWRDKNKLDTERQFFMEQKENFEKERQIFIEAVRKLDRERQMFEDQKASFFHDNLPGDSTQELESFFTKLCSTPAKSPEMNLSSKYLSHQHDVHASSGSSSVLQDSISPHNDVDLKHNLSMCSDDGMSVLNERPVAASRSSDS